MLSLRLVIDTNIVVSAALKPEGLQRTVFLLATSRPAQLYVSDPILREYRAVLFRPELHIRKGLRLQYLQFIKNRSRLVNPIRSGKSPAIPRTTFSLSVRRPLARTTSSPAMRVTFQSFGGIPRSFRLVNSSR